VKDLWTLLLGLIALALAFVCASSKTNAPAVAVAPPPVAAPTAVRAASAALALGGDGGVIVEGVVASDAVKSQLLEAVRAVYGAPRVTDRVTVDAGVGALGGAVLTGEVGSEKAKSEAGERAQRGLGSAIKVDNRLRVAAAAVQQRELKALLAGKTIEFESGQAVLRPIGIKLLDELVPVIQQDKTTRVEIHGHTDNLGDPAFNKALSEARAKETIRFLVSRGVAAERLTAAGYGAEQPIADNATADGRQQNRRIDFVVREK
jgi:OmpA-OmpF porin, OOP family